MGLCAQTLPQPRTIAGPRMRAVVENGKLVSLENRATGEQYLRPGSAELLPLGVRYKTDRQNQWAAAQGAPVAVEEGKDSVEYEFQALRRTGETFPALFRVRYSMGRSGDLVVKAYCASERPGVGEVEWTLNGINPELTLILPIRSGVQIRKTDELMKSGNFLWPVWWKAQLAIVESPRGGGFYVFGEDTGQRFKTLYVERNDQQHALGFGTQNQAPFDVLTRGQSIEWHIDAFQGDWRNPAGRFRQWMENTYHPAETHRSQPAWVKDLQAAVSWTPIFPKAPSPANPPAAASGTRTVTKELFEQFATLVTPSKTVLHIPNWRSDPYDQFYPRYEPNDDFLNFLDWTRKKGFRVMPHFNFFAISPASDFYKKFSMFQLRNPFSGALDGWRWDTDQPVRMAYMNPALPEWRDEMVRRVKSVTDRLKLEAVFLDQTLLNVNDAGGLVDGISSIEGNLRLHEQMAKALPGVAIGGEGPTEISYLYESIGQGHCYPSNSPDTPDQVRTSHPICAYLFSPYTRFIGYTGKDPLLVAGFMRAIDGIPTLIGINPGNTNPETAKKILQRATPEKPRRR
jgi:hypothetical protein